MKKFLAFLFLFFSLNAGSLRATDLDIRTLTIFQSRERALSLEKEKRESLLYEYMDLSLHDIGKDGLSFSAYGWERGASDLAFGEDSENGTLSYAFLSYDAKKWKTHFQLGRIFSFSGSSFEQFDGFSMSGNFIPGMNIKIFAGSPVNATPFSQGRGDAIYGARVSIPFKRVLDIGINYLKEQDSQSSSREETGFDVWLKAARFIDVSGHLFYNKKTDHLSDYRALILLRPHEKLTISSEFSKYIYSDYFFASPLSVFHFPNGEELRKFQVGFDTSLTQKLSLDVRYRSFHFKEKDPANFYSAGVRYHLAGEHSYSGISFHRMDGEDQTQQYDEIQSFLFLQKNKFEGSFYLVGTFYKEAIFNVDHVYQFLASSGMRIKDNLTLSADLQYDRNPQYQKDITGMIRLRYRFSKTF